MVDHDQVLREHGYHPLRVARVVQETHDTRSYVLDVPDELRETYRYRAGQFCTFRVRLGEDEHTRCYSMSSAPETDPELTVTVKRVPGGLISNWFHDHLAVGDTVETSKPAGVFCAREGRRPVVAFCGGSGVTPVISIAKSLLATTERPISMLYANRDAGSVIFDSELRELVRRGADRLRLRHHLDTDGGFLTEAGIVEFVGGEIDADFYICGPAPFMDLVESTLLGLGVDPAQIAIERFGVTPEQVAPAPSAAPLDTSPGAGPTAPPDGDATEALTLVIRGKSRTVEYQPGDTVLQMARRASLQPPYSCEAGNCATCMAIVREGSATMRVNNALTPEEVADGWVLTCQALPVGRHVTVEYEAL